MPTPQKPVGRMSARKGGTGRNIRLWDLDAPEGSTAAELLKAYQGAGMIEIPSGVAYAVIFGFGAKEKSQFANDESRQSGTGHVTDPIGMIEATTVPMEKMTIAR